MRNIIFSLFFCLSLTSFATSIAPGSHALIQQNKIAINNAHLAKLNGRVISVIDIVKEMDMYLYIYRKDIFFDPIAKFQFYTHEWRDYLEEQINLELLKLEAEEKKYSISDTEVRQELLERYGVNLIHKLAEAGINYDDAKESMKNEILISRMSWYGYYQKALYSVGPQMIKKAYDEYLEANPQKETWKYQILTIRANDKESFNKTLHAFQMLQADNCPSLSEIKEALTTPKLEIPNVKISITDELVVDSRSIAPHHKSALENMQVLKISDPYIQEGSKEEVARIFFLKEHTKDKVPTFKELSDQIKNQLVARLAEREKNAYFTGLRQKRGYHDGGLYLPLPENYEPFVLR